MIALALPVAAQPGPTLGPPRPETEIQTPAGPPVPVAPPVTRADVEASLDGFLPYTLQRGDITRAVVVVVKDGQVLRRVWTEQYTKKEGRLVWRDSEEMPAPAELIHSPYDPEACYSAKGETTWVGYKVHLMKDVRPRSATSDPPRRDDARRHP